MLSDDLTPAERAAFLFGAMTQMYDGRMLDAKTTLDDMQDIAEKLLRNQPDFLLPEYDQPATHWLRAVLFNRERDRRRAENRHQRIERANALGLAARFKDGTTESAEEVYLRYEADLEIRRLILRLPRRLGVIAMLLYDGYNSAEIARALHIPASTVRTRMQSIRSPRIRAALCISS
jgi:DNA-directed RNA polymerase specialized sigma24 family protein